MSPRKHCCEAATRKRTKVAGMLRSSGRLLGLFRGSGGSLLGRHDVGVVGADRTEAGDSGDMFRVTINSVVGGVRSWDVRRWWYRGRARGGAFQILYSSAAFTITRAGRQALSLFRAGRHNTNSTMRPDAVFLLGAILDWVILCFLLSIMLFLACARVRIISPFERDRARGFADRTWLDELSLYFITHGATVFCSHNFTVVWSI